MRTTKLFFVASWALMLSLQARAKAVDGIESNREAQIVCLNKAAPRRPLTADQLRARLVDALLNCEMYSSYKNAVLFVEKLSDEEVQALLDPASDEKLLKMTEVSSGIQPMRVGPR